MSAVLLCLAGAANAGDARSHGVSGHNMASKSQTVLFGVDSDFSMPISSAYSDANGLGLGALLTVEYPLPMIEQLSLTARAGFSYHLDKNPPGAPTVDVHVHNIPVLFGAKYYLMENDRQGLFAAAEMGIFDLMAGSSVGTVTGDGVKFGIGAGVGYAYKEWNFRVNLHSHDVGNFGDFLAVSGGIGYQFGGI
ncbi:MAG TPA: hypothetical protein VG496_18705 [Myxococcales bacterium]|nr:hypothetical protein [Myxococcales bacterium]